MQLPLMDLLIEHGAIIDGPDGGSAVNGCLHNGRGEAAEFFANRGARLDLEGAAGVGRLDVVKSFFNEDGSLKPPATPAQLKDGFAWACEFGRTSVVDFLLQKGLEVDASSTRRANRPALGRLRRTRRHRQAATEARRAGGRRRTRATAERPWSGRCTAGVIPRTRRLHTGAITK